MGAELTDAGYPASVSSAPIDVIDLVPRQGDPKGQQDKHPGNGPPGVPPLRAVWGAEFISYELNTLHVVMVIIFFDH